jgi:hypothetical protein
MKSQEEKQLLEFVQHERQRIEKELAGLPTQLVELNTIAKPRRPTEKDTLYDPQGVLIAQINHLQEDLASLSQLSDMLRRYYEQTQAEFRAIEARDNQTERQQIKLTIVSSTISLLIGWLLSLIGTPTTLYQILSHH